MNTSNIQSGLGLQPTSSQPAGESQSAPTGASFQALLEKLESQASGLGAQAAETANAPEDLGGAVADARSSLDAALNLSRDLLEAYREAHLGDAA